MSNTKKIRQSKRIVDYFKIIFYFSIMATIYSLIALLGWLFLDYRVKNLSLFANIIYWSISFIIIIHVGRVSANIGYLTQIETYKTKLKRSLAIIILVSLILLINSYFFSHSEFLFSLFILYLVMLGFGIIDLLFIHSPFQIEIKQPENGRIYQANNGQIHIDTEDQIIKFKIVGKKKKNIICQYCGISNFNNVKKFLWKSNDKNLLFPRKNFNKLNRGQFKIDIKKLRRVLENSKVSGNEFFIICHLKYDSKFFNIKKEVDITMDLILDPVKNSKEDIKNKNLRNIFNINKQIFYRILFFSLGLSLIFFSLYLKYHKWFEFNLNNNVDFQIFKSLQDNKYLIFANICIILGIIFIYSGLFYNFWLELKKLRNTQTFKLQKKILTNILLEFTNIILLILPIEVVLNWNSIFISPDGQYYNFTIYDLVYIFSIFFWIIFSCVELSYIVYLWLKGNIDSRLAILLPVLLTIIGFLLGKK